MRWLLALLVAGCASAGPIDPSAMDDATFERELAARFQYGPPEPAPGNVEDQRAGQIADAEYLTRFPEFDRSYSRASRTQAERLLAQLRTDAGSLSHEQFVLRVAEIAALADNGHTSIGKNAFKKNTPRLPLRTYQFAEGLYVVWAAPQFSDLLGARIDAIDGHSIESIHTAIRRYAGGTDAHRQRMLTAMLESPALLQAAGLVSSRDALTLRGVLLSGAPFERRIEAEQRDRSAWVSSSQRLLFPVWEDAPMVSLMRDGDTLPAYLRHRTELFSLESLPDDGLYIGLSHNADTDETPIATFLHSAATRIRAEHPAYVVLDMRMNGGGDYTTTYAFARALPQTANGAPIYVFTSPWTFSAAITTVAALKDAGGDQVIIVGEAVGDRLDFWAEGGSFNLPNAFVQVHYATGRHIYDGPCSDRATCFWLNERYPVRVHTLVPDIAAPLTFAAYRERRDPALDAVLVREARRRSSARTH
ncbi:MAG: hypothetical protein NT015_09260 [Alphaproteobacteria bacterium]|nr:hypothetical protein [Alphaproteobacteria bacterium]